MAKIVTITNPLTGQPSQVDQLDHTAQQIDDAVALAPQLSNPNLLDNWYFAYPVNQRNVSGAIDAVGYFLDRWKLVSGSVTIGSNGITLNGTIAQILETAVGTDVTASALTTEGVVVASYDNNSKTISLTGTGQTFVAAKLELGTTQTLAHQDENGNWVLNEIPNYGEQLRRCMRYFQVITNGTLVGSLYTSQSGRVYYHFPVTMRDNPSIINNPKGLTLWGHSPANGSHKVNLQTNPNVTVDGFDIDFSVIDAGTFGTSGWGVVINTIDINTNNNEPICWATAEL